MLLLPGKQATQYAQEIMENIGYYEYNVWNQMTKSTSNNNTVTCKYNGEGLMVEKTVNGQTIRYLYEYDRVV